MYCPHCVSKIEESYKKCPYCGKDTTFRNPENALPVGSILSGRYYVGAVLGQGGFGITYVGCDKRLNKKIAIKEYYPAGIVNRVSEHSTNLSITTGSNTDIFNHEKQKFIREAQLLAEFEEDPNVVNVTDILVEHNTAYIVMAFVGGTTLTDYIKSHGKMSVKEAYGMLEPLMDSLSSIHAKGLIHRDISPDNIMVQKNGRVILLDFGSAREFCSNDEGKSMSVILKHGYAPAEQYLSRGPQGPWTDVYALCATMYKMITGITPPSAVERMVGDVLKKPSELGVEITPAQEDALLKGLSIIQTERFSSVMDLKKAMAPKKDTTVEPVRNLEKQKPQEKLNKEIPEEPLLDDSYDVLDPENKVLVEKDLQEQSRKLKVDLPVILIDDFDGPDFKAWGESYLDELYRERKSLRENGSVLLVISVKRFQCVIKTYGELRKAIDDKEKFILINKVFSEYKSKGIVSAILFYSEMIAKYVSSIEKKETDDEIKIIPITAPIPEKEKKHFDVITLLQIVAGIVLVLALAAVIFKWYSNYHIQGDASNILPDPSNDIVITTHPEMDYAKMVYDQTNLFLRMS